MENYQEEDGAGLERLTSPFTPHAPQEAPEEEEGIDLEGTTGCRPRLHGENRG